MLLNETILLIYWFSIYMLGEYVLEILNFSRKTNVIILVCVAICAGIWLNKYDRAVQGNKLDK